MNSVIITGRLTRDPEVKAIKDTFVAAIIIAVEDRIKGESKVSYVPVTVWGSIASAVGKYLLKGSQVAVKGKLIQKVYKNTDGKTVSRIEVTAESVEFLSSKSAKTENHDHVDEEITDELPF